MSALDGVKRTKVEVCSRCGVALCVEGAPPRYGSCGDGECSPRLMEFVGVEDAERLVAQVESERDVQEMVAGEGSETQRGECDRPPAGWRCTRDRGHDGPQQPQPVGGLSDGDRKRLKEIADALAGEAMGMGHPEHEQFNGYAESLRNLANRPAGEGLREALEAAEALATQLSPVRTARTEQNINIAHEMAERLRVHLRRLTPPQQQSKEGDAQ